MSNPSEPSDPTRGALRRFARVLTAAFLAGGVPAVIAAIQRPETFDLGANILGVSGVAVLAAVLAALDKAVRTRRGSWVGLLRVN